MKSSCPPQAIVLMLSVISYACFAENGGTEQIPCDSLSCDDGNLCTVDTCQGTLCFYDTISGCIDLCDSLVCNDNDICTQDSCANGACVFTEIPACMDPCDSLSCNDSISCTLDTCLNGACVNIPIIINLGNIEGPPCVAVTTTGTYLIDSLGPDYLYQWQVGGIGEFTDSIASFQETMISWNDTGITTLSAIVFNNTCSDTALLDILVVEDAHCCPNRCPATGVIDETDKTILKILPNPSDGNFIIQLEGTLNGQAEITLQNILGQAVFETVLNLNESLPAFPVKLNHLDD